jgi:glycerol-3-phosphate dehydrogenase (NAD(P)+)
VSVTILGAGAMGAALTTPATRNGHDVRLWGTWLDGELLAAVREGLPHPRLGVVLDKRARLYEADRIADALAGTSLAVLAVSSDAVLDVARHVRPHLPDGVPVAMTTKGFGLDADDRVRLLPPLLAEVLPGHPLIAIGGPCKANEVAAGRPTATGYASEDPVALAAAVSALRTDTYRIESSADVTGLELAAAMKNVYAIALGVCDGLGEVSEVPWHNLKAAAFAQAVREMRTLAAALGGTDEAVFGLPGVGDLEVTGLSGRNKVYGARLGRGEQAGAALAEMRRAGQTVEGVPAARLAARLVDQCLPDGSLPLLRALDAVLAGEIGEDTVDRILAEAVLP